MEENKPLKFAVALVVVFLAGIVLKAAREVLYPFFLAVFVSYLFDPIIGFFMRLGLPKAAAVTLVLLGSFALLLVVGVVVYSSGRTMAAELPRFEQRFAELMGKVEKSAGGVPLMERAASYLEKIKLENVAASVMGVAGSMAGLLARLFALFLFLAFIVAGRGRAAAKVRRALSAERSAQVMGAIENINSQVRKYLVIKTVMSLANGLMVWAVLAAFGVDFALIFGFLAFLLNFIPNVGSLIATVLRVGFALFQFGTIWTPLWILVITVGLDTIMGNLVEPRLMGKGLDLSPVVVLFALVFWGWLWGIPGVIMAVPLVAVIKIVCQNVPALEPVAVLMSA
jgi:AI-2 transport protein TqsA